MGVQRYVLRSGAVRYRARVKFHGREVATRVFERRADATAWEQDQRGRLRLGEWTDPRRGQVPLLEVAADWLSSRGLVKRRTARAMSRAGVTTSGLVSATGRWPRSPPLRCRPGLAAWLPVAWPRRRRRAPWPRCAPPSRSPWLMAGSVTTWRQLSARRPAAEPGGRDRRSPWPSCTRSRAACAGSYRDVVPVLALAGLRWGEMAGLRVGDRVSVRGPGLRLSRAVLASEGGGALYVDTLKNHRARTVPLVAELVPIIDRWSAGKEPQAWLFAAPGGGPLRESNWKRSVGWRAARVAAGVPDVRVHDLRHTAASQWLAAGADPKVVQRVLGHATAAMTMGLYGHLVDASLWQAAMLIGGTTGHLSDWRAHSNGIRAGAGCEKPLGTGLSDGSRLGESNPRPTHYEGVLVRCSRFQSPRWLHVRRLLLAAIVGC